VSQQSECVEAGRVSAFERYLQRVLTNQSHIFDPELVGTEVFDPVESTWCARFAAALRAWTRPSELFGGVAAAHAVFPNYFHHLTLTVGVDGGWKRVGVLQLDA
jgi:hypothetical protein